MRAIERLAEFDAKGNFIIHNPPALKNKKVKLLILIEDEENEFYDLSMAGLSKAYSEDEPDYDVSMIKEPNPDYNK